MLNDFTALALALPGLAAEQLVQVGGGQAMPNSAIGLLGPGTGLGVSGLLPDGRGGWLPLQGEGGHLSLAPAGAREQIVVDHLTRTYGHAPRPSAPSAAWAWSISTVRSAWPMACRLPKAGALPRSVPPHCPVRTRAARGAGHDVRLARLGGGNLALTLGARGRRLHWRRHRAAPGRLVCPFAIPPALPRPRDASSPYLAEIPVWVINASQSPALAGAAVALDQG